MTSPRRTILLVDDEHPLREAMRETLEAEGYSVLEGSDGKDALERLSSWQGGIDLVLTDLYMPGMDGVALARKLRCHNPRLPVLFMSGFPLDARAALAGASFLYKPVTPAALKHVVRTALETASRRIG
jgi:CheY-like chemotaxis protein